jgi:hypothetical protein
MLRKLAVPVLLAVCAIVASGCGAQFGGEGRRLRVPAALPAEVPLPEGATLRSAIDHGSKGLTLVFETDEPVPVVEGRLRSRLEAGGWTQLSAVEVAGGVFSSYRSRGRSVSLGISRSGGVTVVGLAYWQPGPGQGGEPG